MFAPSNPPVSLLISRLTSVPSCWVIAIGRLVVKRCSGSCPATYFIFKIEFASLRKYANNNNNKIMSSSLRILYHSTVRPQWDYRPSEFQRHAAMIVRFSDFRVLDNARAFSRPLGYVHCWFSPFLQRFSLVLRSSYKNQHLQILIRSR